MTTFSKDYIESTAEAGKPVFALDHNQLKICLAHDSKYNDIVHNYVYQYLNGEKLSPQAESFLLEAKVLYVPSIATVQ